jgi:hypothetical protein
MIPAANGEPLEFVYTKGRDERATTAASTKKATIAS